MSYIIDIPPATPPTPTPPAGNPGDIQFNNGGVFGGEALVPLAHGGTNADLSATGGTHFVLRQSTVGGAITVSQLDYSDLSGTPQLAQTKAAITSNWLNSYTASTGLFTATQPAFTDISGSIAIGQTPLTTLGDTLYVDSTPALHRLAGNITTTKMYLSQTGNGAISAAPAWAQINYADITGTVPTPPSGSVLWSALGNAGADLSLSNAGFKTTFNQTSAVNWTWANTTAATGGVIPVFGNAVSSNTGTIALTINVGDCVVLFSNAGDSSAHTVSDNGAGGGNTYTKQGVEFTVAGKGDMWVCLSATVSATSVTITGGVGKSLTGITYTGVGAIGAIHNSNGSGTAVSDAVTTTQNNSVVVSGVGAYNPSPSTFTATGAATKQASSASVTSPATVLGAVLTQTVASSGTVATSSGTLGGTATWYQWSIELLAGAINSATPVLIVAGKYWNGVASSTDAWTLQSSVSSSSNGASTLYILHSGTSGLAAVSVPALVNVLSYGNIAAQNTTPATASTTNASPTISVVGNYWTGAASAADTWTISSSLAAGTTGASTLTIAHSGSSGKAAVNIPLLNLGGVDNGISRLGAASLAIGNGTAGDFSGSLKLTGLSVQGALTDGSASVGTAGQVLSSTGTKVAWVNAGSAGVVATSDLTAQSASITATTIYAVPAAGAGLYRISWVATITTVDSTGFTLGGTTSFQAKYTNKSDSVVKTSNPTTPTVSAINATGTSISGVIYANCKASTNLQYLFAITTLTGDGRYDLSIRVEALL